ncbi:MaoC/PaaZ C-terminal domain-containing protein [Umezawaea sp. Da 62-37]|uniref:MaoC/PaaZ C-terminal domain-containing protein n=1 Tax=Umezawaea sp. Da 62-37 TaxID=3075927 RepID=UPI0028F6FEA6|nr:MaoC/PaaZ C-terminal domain-containing protein [Umezawaea sp. Da 62-37]WNV91935.1 MaoC/PaaZ C-terminal domain-containing protein [Umezawaea sp. Da 62-37]
MTNLALLYAKAGLTGFARRGNELPPTEPTAHVVVDRAHLAAYNEVCGFRIGENLPVTYPHVLGFPLQLRLMTDRAFPFALAGLVHVANRVTQSRALTATDPLALTVHAENLRPHDRGTQFDVVTTAAVADEVVWTGTSTYLKRGGGPGPGTGDRTAAPPPTGVWRVPADIGRRYAAVSGDRNPIHLHPLAAKAFGFPRAIAHGMWTKARCLAAFEGRLPDACTVEIRFKAPVLLPATVDFSTDGRHFALHHPKSGKPHLTGTVLL